MGSRKASTLELIQFTTDVEIRVDTTVATSTKQSANRPDIAIVDKKRSKIILIEIYMTSYMKIKRKYNLLINEIG